MAPSTFGLPGHRNGRLGGKLCKKRVKSRICSVALDLPLFLSQCVSLSVTPSLCLSLPLSPTSLYVSLSLCVSLCLCLLISVSLPLSPSPSLLHPHLSPTIQLLLWLFWRGIQLRFSGLGLVLQTKEVKICTQNSSLAFLPNLAPKRLKVLSGDVVTGASGEPTKASRLSTG